MGTVSLRPAWQRGWGQGARRLPWLPWPQSWSGRGIRKQIPRRRCDAHIHFTRRIAEARGEHPGGPLNSASQTLSRAPQWSPGGDRPDSSKPGNRSDGGTQQELSGGLRVTVPSRGLFPRPPTTPRASEEQPGQRFPFRVRHHTGLSLEFVHAGPHGP